MDVEASHTAQEARETLVSFLSGAVTLDALIAWAEGLEAQGAADRWLRHVAAELSNPLLCREEATALVHDFLRAKAPGDG